MYLVRTKDDALGGLCTRCLSHLIRGAGLQGRVESWRSLEVRILVCGVVSAFSRSDEGVSRRLSFAVKLNKSRSLVWLRSSLQSILFGRFALPVSTDFAGFHSATFHGVVVSVLVNVAS